MGLQGIPADAGQGNGTLAQLCIRRRELAGSGLGQERAGNEEERGRSSGDKPNDLNTVVFYLHAGCFYMLVSNFIEC